MVSSSSPSGQRTLFVALGIAAAVLFGLVSFAIPGPGPIAPQDASEDDGDRQARLTAGSVDSRTRATAKRHSTGARQSSQSENLATITGRLIDRPVAEVGFDLEIAGASPDTVVTHTELLIPASDGSFQLLVHAPTEGAVHTLWITGDDLARHAVRLNELTSGTAISLGDIPLTRSQPFRIEVVDVEGRPMPDVEVHLEEPVVPLGLRDSIARPEQVDPVHDVTTTDPNGVSDLGRLHPATQITEVLDRRRTRVVHLIDTQRLADGTRRLVIELRDPELSGRVTGDIEDWSETVLEFRGTGGDPQAFWTRPDAEGRFAVARPSRIRSAEFCPTLQLPDGRELLCSIDRVPAPSAGLLLDFPDDPGFEIFVNGPDGEPTYDVAFHWVDVDGRSTPARGVVQRRSGHFWVARSAAPLTDPRLYAIAGKWCAPSATVRPENGVFHLQMTPWKAKRFRLVGGDGMPITGRYLMVYDASGRQALGTHGTSSRDGTALVEVPSDTGFTIKISHGARSFRFEKGHGFAEVEDLVLDDLVTVDLQVTGIALGDWPDGTSVRISLDQPSVSSGLLEGDGGEGFSLSGLPIGETVAGSALVQVPHRGLRPLPGSRFSFVVAAGGQHVIDLGRVGPGSVEVRVPRTDNDSPYQRGPAGLFLADAPAAGRTPISPNLVIGAGDAHELWLFESLPAGLYEALGTEPFASHRIEVQAGSKMQAVVTRISNRLEVALTDPAGLPIANQRVRILSHEPIARRMSMSTDAEGRLVLEPVPVSKLTFLVGENQARRKASLVVDSETGTFSKTLQLK